MSIPERKVDLNNVDVENLSEQLGQRVREIVDEAALKCNKILNIYGMSVKIACAFDTLENMNKKMEVPKKKRGRKPKENNLNKEPKI